MLTLLKFSTHDCQVCQRMRAIDSRVASELGLAFVDVDLRHPEIYGRYRQILLRQHPLKSTLALPSYLLVSDPDGDAIIHAELVGSMPEPEFRSQLQALIPAVAAGSSALPPGPGD